MDIKKYIENKDNIHIYNLVNNKDIIPYYNLESYPVHDSIEIIDNNPFLENQLFIFIIDSSQLIKIFFNKIKIFNNTLLFIINNDDFKENSVEYKKLLISYGYKYHEMDDNNEIIVFIYDISEYKDNPDWLNSENWANPDLWDK